MKQLLAVAAFLLASSAAQAQYSFQYGGHTIRIDPDRGTVSIPGVYDNTGRKSKRARTDQESTHKQQQSPQEAKVDPQVQPQPQQAPADAAATPAAPPVAPAPANALPEPPATTANNAPADTAALPPPPAPPAPAPQAPQEAAAPNPPPRLHPLRWLPFRRRCRFPWSGRRRLLP
jgi:hypothetical protein